MFPLSFELRLARHLAALAGSAVAASGCDPGAGEAPDYCAGDPLPSGYGFAGGEIAVPPGAECPAAEPDLPVGIEGCGGTFSWKQTCELTGRDDRQVATGFGGYADADTGEAAEDICRYRAVFDLSVKVVCGRPLIVGESAVVAAVLPAVPGWSEPALAPDLAGLGLREREILAEHWARAAAAEHASIASFAVFTLDLLRFGAPPELVEEAQRAGLDESRHARGCFALASAYGGRVGPAPLPLDGFEGRPLLGFAEALVREGCIGETLAAIEAGARLRVARDPAVRALLATLVEDEARHAALAWRTLSWLLRQHPTLRAPLAHLFEREPRCDGAGGDPIPEHGLIGGDEVARALGDGWRQVVRPAWRASPWRALHSTSTWRSTPG